MQRRPLPALRDVHRGTAQDQHPHHTQVTEEGSEVKGSPLFTIGDIGISPGIQQVADDGHELAADGHMERCPSIAFYGIHLAPRLQDAAEAFVALPGRGQKQRRGTVFGSQIHGGFLCQKKLHEFAVSIGRRNVHRLQLALFGFLAIHAHPDQGFKHLRKAQGHVHGFRFTLRLDQDIGCFSAVAARSQLQGRTALVVGHIQRCSSKG
mmetsp:Transcript_38812/g.83575  ORF Transcript_38812/g.83575 Transcript_38812/m.83575 type:complete len:208 (+) Transcript_38812:1696-2319(+)